MSTIPYEQKKPKLSSNFCRQLTVKSCLLTAGKAVWDVHRHRVAPEIHKALFEYFVDGDAEVVSAHLVGLNTSKKGTILAKLDLGKKTEERDYDYIVNCTGPNNCESSVPSSCSWYESRQTLFVLIQKSRRSDKNDVLSVGSAELAKLAVT